MIWSPSQTIVTVDKNKDKGSSEIGGIKNEHGFGVSGSNLELLIL